MAGLHARVTGQGPPVVLVHSSGMAARQWRTLTARLAPTHRVIAPDLLGYGDNPPWPEDAPFEFQRDVDALAALVTSLGEPVHLVGHSYGGLIALMCARQHPALVRSLALYDPVAIGVLHDAGDELGLGMLAAVDERSEFLDERLAGTERWWELFVDYWNGPGAWRALPAAAREGFLRVGKKPYFEVRSLLRDRTERAAYAAIEAPVLLLTGEHSPTVAHRTNAQLAQAMPHARLRTVAGAGHMGPLSHAEQVNELIAGHIAAGS